VGAQLTVGDVFEKGQTVKVSGTSKGKGFQGTIKRHNFSRGPVTHGSHNVRAPGSIGQSATPSRVFRGMKGPGQMGNARVTQRGLEVVDVRADENLLLVRGSVPGPKGSVVEIRSDG
jgi:large subunit ribosomal protein L3